MSILDTIVSKYEMTEPPIILIAGDPGIGKSTLGATFPKPIFIRAEDGLRRVSAIVKENMPDSFPPLNGDVDLLFEQIKALGTEEHDYKTLVIDSITKLENDFVDKVLKDDENKPKSINQAFGGYGRGFDHVAYYHDKLVKFADKLRQKKRMNIVFLAHTEVKSIDLPNSDPYSVFGMPLSKKSLMPYTHHSDLIGFLRDEVFVKHKDQKSAATGQKGKAVGSGRIMLTAHKTPWCCSKNGYGIDSDLVVDEGENPLIDYIPALQEGN